MLKNLLNVFRTVKVYDPPKTDPSQLSPEALQYMLGDYSHGGLADDLTLPSDRFNGLPVYVLGVTDLDLAHDIALSFNGVIDSMRNIIGNAYGTNYAKWFTHSVLHFEVDARYSDEGLAPILRIVYRGVHDQRLGSLITREVWDQIVEALPDDQTFPKVTIINCFIGYPRETDGSQPLDTDYRLDRSRAIASRAEREVRVEAADV